MAHLARGQHRVRRLNHRRAVFRIDQPATGQTADLQVGAGEDCNDPRRGAGIAGVDAGDLSMRVGASQNVSIELAGTIDVVRVVTGAGEKAKIFFAPH